MPVQTMLSMKPLLVDGIQGMKATDHLEHLTKILLSYGKTCADIICLVGDNCSVNQSMAQTLKVPLLGCASHKFNLAVRRWISSKPELTLIINKVSVLLLSAVLIFAALECCCRLCYSSRLCCLSLQACLSNNSLLSYIKTGEPGHEESQHIESGFSASRADQVCCHSRK